MRRSGRQTGPQPALSGNAFPLRAPADGGTPAQPDPRPLPALSVEAVPSDSSRPFLMKPERGRGARPNEQTGYLMRITR